MAYFTIFPISWEIRGVALIMKLNFISIMCLVSVNIFLFFDRSVSSYSLLYFLQFTVLKLIIFYLFIIQYLIKIEIC